MALPKRVPWANLAELDELCNWVYSDQTDIASKQLAKNRLCAWQVNCPLPHALESVLCFLNAVLLESNNTSASTLCQVYALALIRFVNGLVDPLQQGIFAKPIYSLAAQIDLPLWLVELRHRSTHEDLPSIEVLREATHQSMQWLLNRYFLPTLSPPSTTELEHIETPPLGPLLAEYKALMKTCLRDASLQGRSKAEIEKLFKGFSAWIGDVSTLYAADLSVQDSESNLTSPKLKFATRRFCQGLCDRNGLVPLSKSKRVPTSSPLGHPPNEGIWAPLVHHFDQSNDYFTEELLAHMLLIVNNNTIAESDPTYPKTMASWVLWIVDTMGDDTLRRDCVRDLLSRAGSEGGNSIAQSLVAALVSQDESLKSLVTDLLAVIKPKQIPWQTDSMNELEDRKRQLEQMLLHSAQAEPVQHTPNTLTGPEDEQLPAGWHQIPQSSWVPCPIGTPI
ncbi:Pre-rRNA-processing protein las1 [Schizosaccharomyces pombe 972h-] [Rhizoctonia solani]|uniref:Pre-rRNA-processing protein las1 [Schizosaccharomyces pombe 972h-] n=1 Tax=Rhizoctonia solani TaxID=456999 RepID=A0A0K6G1U2_9AGAM|nr:Pre-rRNA-processing protein las1 [Schizosaccharomyces pombe 972h-] [Rhizoctonia solani]